MKQDRPEPWPNDPDTLDAPNGPDAVAALWRRHRHWVAAVLHAHRPRRAGAPDLDDLLQEVAMVLVRKQDELARVEAIEPWLRTVAVNVARDAGRRVTAAGKLDPIRLSQGRTDDAAGDDDAEPSRAAAALEIAQSLPMDYAEPLLLSLRGLSYRQVGLVMNLPESTIQNRLYRARAMVREELQRIAAWPALRLATTTRSASHG